jgi:hypothetical protein
MATNVDRALTPIEDMDEEDIEVTFENPDMAMAEDPEAVVIENEDGSVTLEFGDDDEGEDVEHDANLAEYMDEKALGLVSGDLLESYDADVRSRKEWSKTYTKGLKLMGLGFEDRTFPWQGASGVFHPMLTEAVIRAQSQMMLEMFPASGPVKGKIVGKETPEKIKQHLRVEHDMNYQLTEVMYEYRNDTEQLLFNLPLAGSAFRKVYYDPTIGRTVACFVPAEDYIVNYGASDLRTAARATHRMKRPLNDIYKLQSVGFYRDVDLPDTVPEYSDIENAEAKIGDQQPTIEQDERHTILEMYVDYDMPGYEDEDGVALPYIVSIDKGSGIILSIYRNWDEGDQYRKKIMHTTHYKYMPGPGFYGLGLIHIIGGLAKSATSVLRQLIDAGTLANLPAGLKSRGLRIKGDDSPIKPGEFRDVDVPGGAIKDNITFLPYKEPSTVLYQLLTGLIDEGRRLASVADLKISDMNSQAPVGTTLAIIERSMKVMSAVQARVHAALKEELRIVARTIRDFGNAEYEYEVDEGATRTEDYDDRIDIIPVSDPNASTMAQRIMQYQAALQLSQQAPHLYDLPELHRQMINALGLKDAEKLLPLSEEQKPMDPIAENMALLNSKPVKAFMYQDHEAHIQVHLAAIEDPKMQQLVGQSPVAQSIAAASAAHIQEHVAFQYRREIEKQMGVELPDPETPLPEDVEVQLSRMVAEAAGRLLQKDKKEAAQQKAKQTEEDPIFQLQKAELAVKQAEVQRKAAEDKMDAHAKEMELATKLTIERERIASKEHIEGAKIGSSAVDSLRENAAQLKEISSKEQIEGAKIGQKAVDSVRKAQSKSLNVNKSIDGNQ